MVAKAVIIVASVFGAYVCVVVILVAVYMISKRRAYDEQLSTISSTHSLATVERGHGHSCGTDQHSHGRRIRSVVEKPTVTRIVHTSPRPAPIKLQRLVLKRTILPRQPPVQEHIVETQKIVVSGNQPAAVKEEKPKSRFRIVKRKVRRKGSRSPKPKVVEAKGVAEGKSHIAQQPQVPQARQEIKTKGSKDDLQKRADEKLAPESDEPVEAHGLVVDTAAAEEKEVASSAESVKTAKSAKTHSKSSKAFAASDAGEIEEDAEEQQENANDELKPKRKHVCKKKKETSEGKALTGKTSTEAASGKQVLPAVSKEQDAEHIYDVRPDEGNEGGAKEDVNAEDTEKKKRHHHKSRSKEKLVIRTLNLGLAKRRAYDEQLSTISSTHSLATVERGHGHSCGTDQHSHGRRIRSVVEKPTVTRIVHTSPRPAPIKLQRLVLKRTILPRQPPVQEHIVETQKIVVSGNQPAAVKEEKPKSRFRIVKRKVRRKGSRSPKPKVVEAKGVAEGKSHITQQPQVPQARQEIKTKGSKDDLQKRADEKLAPESDEPVEAHGLVADTAAAEEKEVASSAESVKTAKSAKTHSKSSKAFAASDAGEIEEDAEEQQENANDELKPKRKHVCKKKKETSEGKALTGKTSTEAASGKQVLPAVSKEQDAEHIYDVRPDEGNEGGAKEDVNAEDTEKKKRHHHKSRSKEKL